MDILADAGHEVVSENAYSNVFKVFNRLKNLNGNLSLQLFTLISHNLAQKDDKYNPKGWRRKKSDQKGTSKVRSINAC